MSDPPTNLSSLLFLKGDLPEGHEGVSGTTGAAVGAIGLSQAGNNGDEFPSFILRALDQWGRVVLQAMRLSPFVRELGMFAECWLNGRMVPSPQEGLFVAVVRPHNLE